MTYGLNRLCTIGIWFSFVLVLGVAGCGLDGAPQERLQDEEPLSGTGADPVASAPIAPTDNHPPTVGPIAPADGESVAGEQVTFSAQYSDADGADHLIYGHIRIGTSADASDALWAIYRRSNNELRLWDNAAGHWSPGCTPGAGTAIENDYARLDCSQTTVDTRNDTLTVNWSFVFHAAFADAVYQTYLYTKDRAGVRSGWQAQGMWTVKRHAGVNSAPATGDVVVPSEDIRPDSQVMLTSTFHDPDGASDFKYGYLLINDELSAKNGFRGYYRTDSGLLYLGNDEGTGWVGSCVPGTSGTLSNSQATLNCAQTQVSLVDKTMSIAWAVTFKRAFSGQTYQTYLYAKDQSGIRTGWIQQRDVNINQPPDAASVAPLAGHAVVNRQTELTTVFADGDGWQNLIYGYLLISNGTKTKNAFWASYRPNENRLYLRDDGDTAWGQGCVPGENRTLTNAQGAISCLNTTADTFGEQASVRWAVTFKAPYRGMPLQTYLYAKDRAGSRTGFIQMGTWVVGDDPTPSDPDCPAGVSMSLPATDGHMVGFNAYYLQEEATRDVRRGYSQSAYLEEVLEKAGSMGVTFIRTWGFNDDPNKVGDTTLQTQKLRYDETSWRGLDLVLYRAAVHGIKLILPLANYWKAYGGTRQYVTWAGLPSPREGDARFFTNRQVIDHYKAHIRNMLNRVNTYDGIRYGEHPAVLAWEVLNEPRGDGLDANGEQMRAWIDEVAAQISGLAPDHLVGTGEEGFDRPDDQFYDADFWSNAAPAWIFQSNASFQYNTASPYIDYGSVHFFPEYWGFPPAWISAAGARWISEHAAVARALGKPLVVAEFGLRNQGAFTLAERRDTYSRWLTCANQTGTGAVSPWMFSYDDRPDGWDEHTFYFFDGTAADNPANRYADLLIQAAANANP